MGCCSHDCSGCADEKSHSVRKKMIFLVLAFALAGLVFRYVETEPWRGILFAAAYLLAGYDVLSAAGRNLVRGRVFDENFLMSLASCGAFAIGERPEAVSVMIFYGVGELLQDFAVERSRRGIVDLMDLRSDSATVLRGGQSVRVAPEEVQVGESIVVLPGEKAPLDGVVEEGNGFLDTRALTGESVERRVVVGDEVLSGVVSVDARLTLRVVRPFGESTVARILQLVREAGDKKSKSEKFITRFARVYTPTVVALALLTAFLPPLFGFGTFSEWIYKALCFLIISCPCALVLSIPLSFFGGIGGAARNGVLVKGGNYLELLEAPDTVVFDKTGTLTHGVFQVVALIPAAGIGEEELLRCAATAEAQSNHPIARSIRAKWSGSVDPVDALTETPGYGVCAQTAAGLIRCGNRALMVRDGIDGVFPAPTDTTVYVACERRYLGAIRIADTVRESAMEAVRELRQLGVRRLAMLTGDAAPIAEKLAAKLGLDEVRAELLPRDKVVELERLMQSSHGVTIYVGDGINDAPVLTRADLGVAMGGAGADAAIEAADVVVMNDDLRRLGTAVRVARRTRSIVVSNIVFALGAKSVVMILALLGFASVWAAILADVGVALLALLNALRALTLRSR